MYFLNKYINKYIKSKNLQEINIDQESGIVLIKKSENINELHTCMYLNYKYKIFYKLLYGDKDTFQLAWILNNKKYYINPNKPILYDIIEISLKEIIYTSSLFICCLIDSFEFVCTVSSF